MGIPAFLPTILGAKQAEVKALKQRRSEFCGRSDKARPFALSLKRNNELAIIAEVKKASPSKGLIRPDFDPVAIAMGYEKGGAAAISVLTDEKFFLGAEQYLKDVRAAVALPVLRKDFIIDTLQVEQSAAMNADAMLLIVAALSDGQLAELYEATFELGMEPLIEIHNGKELDRAMRLSPPLLGINNRDLKTFQVSLDVTIELMRHIPGEVTVVSESGIANADDARFCRDAGVRALLVGESLVRLADPGPLMHILSLCEKQGAP